MRAEGDERKAREHTGYADKYAADLRDFDAKERSA